MLIILGTILELVATEWKVWLAAKTSKRCSVPRSTIADIGAPVFGLGLGFTQTIVNTYNSELGPPQIRGACIALYQLGFALGASSSDLHLTIDAMSSRSRRHLLAGQLTSSIALQVVVTSYPGSRGYMNALYSEWVLHGKSRKTRRGRRQWLTPKSQASGSVCWSPSRRAPGTWLAVASTRRQRRPSSGSSAASRDTTSTSRRPCRPNPGIC